MQITQYEIGHEFYAQSVISLCTVMLVILLIELNKIANHCGSIYETSMSFTKKLK